MEPDQITKYGYHRGKYVDRDRYLILIKVYLPSVDIRYRCTDIK